jgi:hypothetical protein
VRFADALSAGFVTRSVSAAVTRGAATVFKENPANKVNDRKTTLGCKTAAGTGWQLTIL